MTTKATTNAVAALTRKVEAGNRCHYCPMTFESPSKLLIHQRSHSGETPFRCDFCRKQFGQGYNLNKHLKRKHVNREQLRKGRKERSYECRYCYKRFLQNGDREQHERCHNGLMMYRCDICEMEFVQKVNASKHRQRHQLTEEDSSYKCHYCYRVSEYRSEHSKHEQWHRGEKAYKCEECSRQFYQLGYLKIHQRIHNSQMDYRCSYCDLVFVQRANAEKHQRLQHFKATTTKLECLFCNGASFAYASELMAHERGHMGLKPYKCRRCQLAFKQPGNRNAHERLHKEDKEDATNVTIAKGRLATGQM